MSDELEAMPRVECSFCCAEFEESEITGLECDHKACTACLRAIFSDYPARCCEYIDITIERAKMLGGSAIEAYIQKRLEKESATKLYCSRPHCSTFIPFERIFDTLAVCPSCHQFTCTNCRQDYHGESPCALDQETKETHELAQQEGWRACHGCGHIIEKTTGCNRMQCVCGAEFCYQCGDVWKTCDCRYFAETPDADEQLTEDQMAQEFMAIMEDTTQYVLEVRERPDVERYLEQIEVRRQRADHPDWFQPFIDDVRAALEAWEVS